MRGLELRCVSDVPGLYEKQTKNRACEREVVLSELSSERHYKYLCCLACLLVDSTSKETKERETDSKSRVNKRPHSYNAKSATTLPTLSRAAE